MSECLGAKVNGPMWAQLCEEDGWVRSGMWHFGTDYKCTGSVHPPLDSPIWPGCEILCANPIHVVTLPLTTLLGTVTVACSNCGAPTSSEPCSQPDGKGGRVAGHWIAGGPFVSTKGDM